MPRNHRRYFLWYIFIPSLFASVIAASALLFFALTGPASGTSLAGMIGLFALSLICVPAAIIGWFCFLRAPVKKGDGWKSGVTTVFLCFITGSLGLSFDTFRWDGISAFFDTFLSMFIMTHIAIGWIAYPIGIFAGRWFGKKLREQAPTNLSTFD